MSQKPRCVFLDRASIDCDDLDLSAIAGSTELTLHDASHSDEVIGKCADAEIIIVNKVRLEREHLAALPALKLICVIATGTNNVDLAAASEHGICVSNVRDYGAASVSQHVMLLILALTAMLVWGDNAFIRSRHEFPAQETPPAPTATSSCGIWPPFSTPIWIGLTPLPWPRPPRGRSIPSGPATRRLSHISRGPRSKRKRKTQVVLEKGTLKAGLAALDASL